MEAVENVSLLDRRNADHHGMLPQRRNKWTIVGKLYAYTGEDVGMRRQICKWPRGRTSNRDKSVRQVYACYLNYGASRCSRVRKGAVNRQ